MRLELAGHLAERSDRLCPGDISADRSDRFPNRNGPTSGRISEITVRHVSSSPCTFVPSRRQSSTMFINVEREARSTLGPKVRTTSSLSRSGQISKSIQDFGTFEPQTNRVGVGDVALECRGRSKLREADVPACERSARALTVIRHRSAESGKPFSALQLVYVLAFLRNIKIFTTGCWSTLTLAWSQGS